ncbi:hypothetical protein A0J61_03426 [Choanephora cucurbitarum]|uniref:Uncharacterized protein n=1 Tax=Choanephora cucurbitarum TaxID=101091 RepID=A0A1C7NHC0_9FUNG|nr:hypothetical protein A0J61_03426 [Choanephora cucurbitarum]
MAFPPSQHNRDSAIIPPEFEPPRFSVNSNLMNYSIPKHNDISPKKQLEMAFPLEQGSENTYKREIQRGDTDTRTRQLEAQIEQLTLQNVKLQRTNRLLKVDTDNLIEQKTSPLEKTIQELTIANVKLQRTSRLLQQELNEKSHQLNMLKQNQILQMKNVGPEYEFLVQNINLLQRQLAGHPSCDEICCFTMKPIDQSTMVMTLPSSEDDDEEVEAQHICRPVIHSTISQGSYAVELENKIYRLEQVIEELDLEKEQIMKQHGLKDNDVETLKKELRIKDEIVSQLEQDFMGLEDQIEHLQKELQDHTLYTEDSPVNRLLTPPPTQNDPQKQSQLLMESKRRTLAIKDTDLLEQMLRGDLEGTEHRSQSQLLSASEEELEDDEININRHISSITTSRSARPRSTLMLIEEEQITNNKGINNTPSCYTCDGFSCTFPCNHSPPPHPTNSKTDDPFALFACIAIILGIASQLGITDDWTVPITLAILVSRFLWSGNKHKRS